MKKLWLVLVVGPLSAAATARADVWDIQTYNDNSPTTVSIDLVHGTIQVHDLGTRPGPVADVDWFTLEQKAYSSYEIVVDGTSGDIQAVAGKGPDVDLVDVNTGITVVSAAPIDAIGHSLSMRLKRDSGFSIKNQWIRVRSSLCATNCGPDDQYTIRFYDTTIAVPHFNNSATLITLLLIQNPTNYSVSGKVFLFNTAGSLITSVTFSNNPHQTLVLNTSTLVPNQSGSIVIVHDARYGDLAGKAMALEPSTGFTFDTPFAVKPH